MPQRLSKNSTRGLTDRFFASIISNPAHLAMRFIRGVRTTAGAAAGISAGLFFGVSASTDREHTAAAESNTSIGSGAGTGSVCAIWSRSSRSAATASSWSTSAKA